jgi:opacity protein-like surface antigen
MAEFDVKRVTTFEWVGIAAGLLALIVSFFPWYSASASVEGVEASDTNTAWTTGIGAWLPVLILLATAVLIALPHIGARVPHLALIWLGLSAAAAVIILLRWLTLPELPEDGGLSDVGLGLANVDIETDSGAGFGLIVGLILALGSAVVAFLSYRAPIPDAAPVEAGPATD